MFQLKDSCGYYEILKSPGQELSPLSSWNINSMQMTTHHLTDDMAKPADNTSESVPFVFLYSLNRQKKAC